MSGTALVFAEQKNGKLRNVAFESLSAARRMVEEAGEVGAVLFNPASVSQAEQLSKYGADRIYVVNDDCLKNYTPDAYRQAFVQLIERVEPDVVVMGHTATGKDIAPRLAARLDTGLTVDCVDVRLEDGDPVFVRPIYAGKAFQKVTFIDRKPMLFTVRPNNIPAEENPRTAESIAVNVSQTDLRTTIKDIVRRSASGVDLSEASVIVSGGRGVKSAEGFKPLRELADTLGGAVGASRAACDAGFCDYALQIGQTGKVVTPDLYIACGISGAIQHLAGMSQSKTIVAINKDPEAPIFQIADYGIVGDLFEIVPKLTDAFRKVLSEH
jgi:electron transfer flavoprotein alpha subunit